MCLDPIERELQATREKDKGNEVDTADTYMYILVYHVLKLSLMIYYPFWSNSNTT
jgi:hypothetical protein